MMKHVSPRAELPLVTAPHINNAMPSRVARPAVKNMTGLYLGTDDHRSYPPPRKIVPPLARVRFPSKRSRTPTEERRYDDALDTDALNDIYILLPAPPFTIPKLPPMPPSRFPLIAPQKMVELLRYKEERRGFSGNPVKRRTPSATSIVEMPPQSATPAQEEEDVAIWDLCRQTQRHFTAATNSGVTHLEYLNPDVDGSVTSHDRDAFTVPLSSTVANEVHRLASDKPDVAQGLVDCYKKVCKGKINVLQHLLPSKSLKEGQVSPTQNFRYTGFTVKSYRNPNQAELKANFSPPPGHDVSRARTVMGGEPQRPFIPSPYFFKSYTPPQRPHTQKGIQHNSPRQGFDEPRISAVPGAGTLSRSVNRGRHNNSPHTNSPLNIEVLHGNSYTAHKPE